MNFLNTVTLIFLVGKLSVNSITVTSSINKHNVTIHALKRNSTDILNQSDRYRRLIPYMTYYIPSENHQNHQIPQIEIVNYVPNKSQHQQQPQRQHQIDSTLYKNNQRPQISAIIYNTRHQAHRTYNSNQPSNYDSYRPLLQQPTKQTIQTLFRANNKIPGPFLPIVYKPNELQYEIKPQTVTIKPPIETSLRPQYHIQNLNNQPTEQNFVNYENTQKYVNYQKPSTAYKYNAFSESTPNSAQIKQISGIQVPYQDPTIQHFSQQFGSDVYVSEKPNVYYQKPISVPKVVTHMVYTSIMPVANTSPSYKSVNSQKYPNIIEQQYHSTVPPFQHLTETTQIQPPTLSTQYPIKNSQKNYLHKPVINRYPIRIPSTSIPKIIITTPKPIPFYNPNSLSDILKKLQETNHLPQTLTPDNIDNSIRTLVRILNELKQSQKVETQSLENQQVVEDYDYHDSDTDDDDDIGSDLPGPNSGRPGIDYPILSKIPQTAFTCKEQRYKGFFGDPDTNCQVWHYCDLNGGQASFLCPNGTIFSQIALTCDWWFNVKCSSTAQLYVLNERLYKYILPFTPKFPEDYSGPLVDKYLALKFEEMEEKMRKQKKEKEEMDDDEEEDEIEEEEDEVGGEIEQEIKDYSTTENVLSSTNSVYPANPTIPKMKTTVESEKLEVIEIKPDGSTGHLIPRQNYEDK